MTITVRSCTLHLLFLAGALGLLVLIFDYTLSLQEASLIDQYHKDPNKHLLVGKVRARGSRKSRFNETSPHELLPIPRLVHQMWKDRSSSPPSECVRWRSGCMMLNEEYEFRLYTDADLLSFTQTFYPEYLDMFKHLNGVYMADMARVLITYHYGGIYMDLDFLCVRPYRCLLKQAYQLLMNQLFESTLSRPMSVPAATNADPVNNAILKTRTLSSSMQSTVASGKITGIDSTKSGTSRLSTDTDTDTNRESIGNLFHQQQRNLMSNQTRSQLGVLGHNDASRAALQTNTTTTGAPTNTTTTGSNIPKLDILIVSREPKIHSVLFRNTTRVVIQDFFMATAKHPFFKWLLDDRLQQFQKYQEQKKIIQNLPVNQNGMTGDPKPPATFPKGPFSYSIDKDILRFYNESRGQSRGAVIVELPEDITHPLADATNSRYTKACYHVHSPQVHVPPVAPSPVSSSSSRTFAPPAPRATVLSLEQERERACDYVRKNRFFHPTDNTVLVHMWTHVYLGWSSLRGLWNSGTYKKVEQSFQPTFTCGDE